MRWLLCLLIIFGGVGCKNQQKIAEEEAARVRAENTAQAKTILNSILNDDGQMTLAEKERKLNQARALNSDDPEVKRQITQVEDMLNREREAQKLAQQPRELDPVSPALEEQLTDLFGKIAGTNSSAAANNLIDEGLAMFSSPQVPVLIIISKAGDLKDYEEPTTIQQYFNYLKDHQKSPDVVYNLEKDVDGKISELELIKKSIR